MRAIGVAVAVLALLCAVPLDASAAAHGSRGNITFGAGPANTKKPDGRTIFTYDASPGGRIEDHVAVLNITHHPEVLRVYTVDVDAGTDGGFVYEPRSAPRVGAGSWVAVGTPHASGFIHAKPQSTTILPIHLTVPTNASPGDHAAAVIVSLTSLVKGKSGQRVDLEQRVAIRVLVRVSGTLRPQLSIEHLQVSPHGRLNPAKGGSVTVRYTVRNTGNAILGGTQQVSVHGLFGITSTAKSLPMIPTLLPGGSYAVTARVSDVFPQFWMTADVKVTPEAITGDVDPGLHAVTAHAHFWDIPWILTAIVLALLVLIEERIRRRRRQVPATPEPDTKTLQGAST